MLMRLMSKGEYLIVPKETKFTGSGKLGLSLKIWDFAFYLPVIRECMPQYWGTLIFDFQKVSALFQS